MKLRELIMLAVLAVLPNAGVAQDITFFFRAGDLSGEADRFGNTHTVGPATAIEEHPFGSAELAGVDFAEDNKWLIYPLEGNLFLVSHAPAGLEDSPELAMEITLAVGGRFEVVLNFLDVRDTPGDGPIQAAIGDAAMETYTELNATPATGGTSPGFPAPGGGTQGVMWWQSVSLGEVEAESGEVIKVRVDDMTSDTIEEFVTSSFQGITLRVKELTGAIAEVQVSPGVFDWAADAGGNQFKTGPVNDALAQEEWITVNANSPSDNLWNIREGLGSYGPILESFPNSGDDAPILQTSVIFARGGIYEAFFSLGDTGAVDPDENLATQTPLNFAFEGEDFTRWHANDGEFKGTPGYNDYEMALGEITARAGQPVNFLIDDVQDGTATRSVYMGMRFVYVGPLEPLPLAVTSTDGNLDFEWESESGMYYLLRSSTDLATELSTWESVDVPGSVENNGVFEIATNPPSNTVSIPRPADPVRFYRVEELLLPPVSAFGPEAFDTTTAGTLPAGWTTGSDGADGTAWELGVPAAGPGAANSGENCIATNLDGDYAEDADIWLRSPAIDLTNASEATLKYAQFVDIEPMFDSGSVRVLDAADQTELALIEEAIDGAGTGWQQIQRAIPEAGVGQVIQIEFRLQSDDFQNFFGWAIDDVEVTTPAP